MKHINHLNHPKPLKHLKEIGEIIGIGGIAEDLGTLIIKNNAPFTVYPLLSWSLPGKAEYFLDIVTVPRDKQYIYVVPTEYYGISGRCYLFYEKPNRPSGSQIQPGYTEAFQLLEFNFQNPPRWNYNISCVDGIGLPVSMVSGDSSVGMYMSLNEYKDMTRKHCPTISYPQNAVPNTATSYKTIGAYNYAVDYILPGKVQDNGIISSYINYYNTHLSDVGNDYMDSMKYVFYEGIDQDKVTQWLYGGNHHRFDPLTQPVLDYQYFDYIAAIERGVSYNDKDNTKMYYKTNFPCNTYAKFVHSTLGFPVYAFANDDHQDQGGFEVGFNNLLTITACPKG